VGGVRAEPKTTTFLKAAHTGRRRGRRSAVPQRAVEELQIGDRDVWSRPIFRAVTIISWIRSRSGCSPSPPRAADALVERRVADGSWLAGQGVNAARGKICHGGSIHHGASARPEKIEPLQGRPILKLDSQASNRKTRRSHDHRHPPQYAAREDRRSHRRGGRSSATTPAPSTARSRPWSRPSATSAPTTRSSRCLLPQVENVHRVQKRYKLVSRESHPQDTIVNVDGVRRSAGPHFCIMAGPCSVESEEQLMATAKAVKAQGATFLRGGAFKPRTSPYEFQGLARKACGCWPRRKEYGLGIVTEVLPSGRRARRAATPTSCRSARATPRTSSSSSSAPAAASPSCSSAA
jgi:hypothetical protein